MPEYRLQEAYSQYAVMFKIFGFLAFLAISIAAGTSIGFVLEEGATVFGAYAGLCLAVEGSLKQRQEDESAGGVEQPKETTAEWTESGRSGWCKGREQEDDHPAADGQIAIERQSSSGP